MMKIIVMDFHTSSFSVVVPSVLMSDHDTQLHCGGLLHTIVQDVHI